MEGFEHYHRREYLSISSLSAFARCPRRYFYGSGCRLEHPTPHVALDFGSCLHKALPETFVNGPEAGRAAFDELWTREGEDDLRTRGRGHAIINDFWESHKENRSIYELIEPPPSNLELSDKISRFEVPFAVDIGLPVPLCGYIDSLVRHRDTGEIWPLDWKSCRQDISSAFRINPQVLGYALVTEALTGKRTPGAMIEAVTVAKTITRTTLVPVYVPRHLLETFRLWAMYIGEQILAMEERQDFLQDPSGCHPYAQFGSHGYNCDFMDLCAVDDWTQLKHLFVQKENKPFMVEKGKVTVNGRDLE